MRNFSLPITGALLVSVGCAVDPDQFEEVSDELAAGETAFVAAADAYVSVASPSTNYGSRSTLEIDASSSGTPAQVSYLRFEVGDIGTIKSARLRFFAKNGTASGPEIRGVSSATWSESGITWNNRPAVDGPLLGTIGSVASRRVVEVDVTGHVTAGAVLSIALVARSTDGLDLSSREASTNRPQLIIATETSSATCGNDVVEGSEQCDGGGCSNGSTCSSSCTCVTSDAALVWVGDFEAPGNFTYGGTYSQFSTNVDTCEHDMTCSTDSMEIVTSPVRGGSRALRVMLRADDVQETSGTRSELKTSGMYFTELNTDYWYGFSIFVPNDWIDDGNQKVVHQWHTTSGQCGGNPVIGHRIIGTSWSITEERETEGDDTTLWTGPMQKGVWTDWVMHVRWSPDNTGALRVWKNGTLVIDRPNAPTVCSGVTTGGHYQKMGMYGSFGSGTDIHTLYFDQLKTAKGPDGYGLVAP